MSESWKETSIWDGEALADRIRRVQLADLELDVSRRPVYESVSPAVDPQEVRDKLDCSQAVTTGEPINVAGYPVGTWFYWGDEEVFVRMVGQEKVCRVELRKDIGL